MFQHFRLVRIFTFNLQVLIAPKNMVRDFKKVRSLSRVCNITDNADKGSIEIFLRLKPQAESRGVQILAVSEAVEFFSRNISC